MLREASMRGVPALRLPKINSFVGRIFIPHGQDPSYRRCAIANGVRRPDGD